MRSRAVRSLMIAMALFLPASALAEGFRGAAFGMTRSAVRATEPRADWVEGPNVMAFRTEVAGLEAAAQYQFVGDALHAGGYRVLEKHANRALYLIDYADLYGLLKEKYGDPVADETLWLNDLYRGRVEDYGMAIAAGHMSKSAKWQTPETELTLEIRGDNYEIEIIVLYKSRALSADADSAARERSLQGL